MDIVAAAFPEPGSQLGAICVQAAGSLNDAARFREALPLAQRGVELGRANQEGFGVGLTRAYWEEARARLGLGDSAAADSLFAVSLELVEGRGGTETPVYAEMEARRWAMKGDRARSLQWLREAVRRGNRDPWLLKNPELDPIRGDPEYRRLATQIRVVLRR
jgi:hypothetical protein